ncbi:adenine phosphoribosyltransferase [Helicobacter monodelphidis]|nr:adenine phosphoribosyltransferase [Helicobacter sp. 15-1451]
MTEKEKNFILRHIRSIPDFPKPGIVFRDITTLLNHAEAFEFLMQKLTERYQTYPLDYIAGIESRGFIFGAALASRLKKGFIPIRKKGKLPSTTITEKYALEYGFDEVEIHIDAFRGEEGCKVLLIDDLIATGGTAEAAVKLITSAKAKCIEACFLLNLLECQGTEKLKNLTPVYTILDI